MIPYIVTQTDATKMLRNVKVALANLDLYEKRCGIGPALDGMRRPQVLVIPQFSQPRRATLTVGGKVGSKSW